MIQRLALIAGLLISFAAPAIAEPPPPAVFEEEPYLSGVYFSSVPCAETFNCGDYYSPEQYIAGADHCASSLLSYTPGIMKYFETAGAYENCVLPGAFQPKGGALGANAQWPICCFDEIDAAPGVCRFTCHSYISG